MGRAAEHVVPPGGRGLVADDEALGVGGDGGVQRAAAAVLLGEHEVVLTTDTPHPLLYAIYQYVQIYIYY